MPAITTKQSLIEGELAQLDHFPTYLLHQMVQTVPIVQIAPEHYELFHAYRVNRNLHTLAGCLAVIPVGYEHDGWSVLIAIISKLQRSGAFRNLKD